MRTSKADANFLSISSNVVEYFSGTPNAQTGTIPVPAVIVPADPQAWDAILKVCDGTSSLNLDTLVVAQGRENAIDCNNHAHDCNFDGDIGKGGPEGDQVITVKGGCYNLTFSGTVWSRGRNAHVVIGAWSDQSFNTSANLDFSLLNHCDGEPLTFILGRVNNPIRALFGITHDIVLPHGAKVLFWKSLGYQLYWWGKWVLVKAGFFK